MKRLTLIVAAIAAALIAAGCGNSGGSGNATEEALSYMPKDAPVVVSIDTDPDGDQWKQVNNLIGKFPFAGQIKSQAKQSFNSSSNLDFDKDIKPILGNEFIVTIPDTGALQQSNSPALGALKVNDSGKAEDFLKKDATKSTTIDGTDVYKESSDTYLAVNDGTLLVADTTELLGAALKRHDGDDHMTEDDFNARMAGLQGDGLVKVGANVQQIIAATPKSAQARKVKWVNGLRDAGEIVTAQGDGIQIQSKATTEGVSEQDLPIASGSESAPVVRRATDIGFGMRNLAQTVSFFEQVGQITDPRGFAKFQARKKRFNSTLGIDVDKDLVSQFEGDAALSVGIDGGFALRSDVKDPDALRATLKKAAPKLSKAVKGQHVGVAVPKKPDGFYALATADGKKYVFAVIGDKFVLATDPSRAAQFAGQSATPVEGAKGALTMAMDTRSIVNQVAQKRGQGQASLITGALGDFTGSVESETSGLTSTFKLNVK